MPRTTKLQLPGGIIRKNATISGSRTLLKGILIGLFCCWMRVDAVAQAPTVSYSSPQVYLRNSAISNLSPTASNVPAQTFRNVTTYAGTGSGGSTNNSNPLSATFDDIVSMVVDARGNIYVAESSGGRSRIRRVAANGGAVVTLMDLNASNHRVWGLAINGSTGDLYFSVTQHAIYRVPNTNSSNYPGQDPNYSSPSDATIESNNRMAGWRGNSGNSNNTTGIDARLNTPLGMDLDATNGFLYVADKDNNRIRKISVTSPYAVETVSTSGVTIDKPEDLVVGPAGVLFATSTTANVVYRIGTDGVVTNFAGSATAGYLDGQGTAARFNDPRGIDMDAAGNLYVADGSGTDAIRKITSGGYVSTLAGSGTGQSGTTEGVGTSARFNVPMEVIVDRTNSLLFVGDNVNDKIRKVEIGGYTVRPSLPDGLSMSATTGVISGTPTVRSRQITYSDDFDDAAGGGGTSIAGNAAYVGGWMRLTDALADGSAAQDGAFRVDASGVNTSGLQVDFKFINGKTSNAADGMSYSFAPDALTTGGSSASLGTGTGLSLSFSTWSGNTIKTNLYYGNGRTHSTSVSGTLLASNTLNNALWLGRTANISLSIDNDGKVTVKVDGTTLFNQVQLPAGYASADKSTWYHVFRASTGFLSDVYAIDDLVIRQGLGSANHTVTAYNADGSATSTLNINVADLPTVASTTAVSSITSTTASTGGNITADGGSAVTTRGVVWSTSANPTVALSTKTSDGTGTGSFTSSLSGLTPNTTYYVRAYSTTAAGTAYGPEVSFTTLSSPPGAPTAVTGRTGVNSAYIDFTAPASNGGVAISNYQYSLDGGAWTALSPAQTNSPLTISGLTACTPYSIKIRAVNSIGNGAESSVVTVTPRSGVASGRFVTRSAPMSGWQSITYGNGLYVAVGVNLLMTSPDGVNWTFSETVVTNTWQSVTFGNNTFVAVGIAGSNRVMTSPDGIRWTARAAVQSNWKSVTFGNNLFVAVANSGTDRVMTSPDGITWTARTPPEVNSWQSVAFGNNTFVAVGNASGSNQVMTSPDGVTWTARTAASVSGWMSIAYGNGRFVAVASTGPSTVMTSDDNGINWTSRFSSLRAFQLRSIAYGNGVFMATRSTERANTIPISSDGGVTWQQSDGLSGGVGYAFGPGGALTYGPGQFVGVAGGPRPEIMNSSDLLAPGIPIIGTISTNASSAVVQFTSPSDPGSDIVRSHAFSLNNGEWQTRFTNPVSFSISGPVSFRLRSQSGVNSNYLGCPTDPVDIHPLMPTTVSDITRNSATGGGHVPSLTNITQSGVVWHTGLGPTVELATKTERGSAVGAFTSTLSGLAPNTTYFIRSYVVYNGGAAVLYGEERSFMTNHDMTSWMSTETARTFGSPSFNLTSPSSRGRGQWSYLSDDPSVATISGNTVTIHGVGSTTVTATQAAVSPYASATASYTLIVNGQAPVINLGIPTTTPLKDANGLVITPTSNSGGNVTLSLGAGSTSATLSGSPGNYTLSAVNNTGDLIFQASVPASGNYAAGTLTRTMSVTKNNPTITFGALSAVTYSNGLTRTLTATGGGSSAPVVFEAVSGPGNITGGNTLNITGPGDIVIKASQAGDATYNPAPDVVRTLTVNAGPPTITGISPTSATVGDVVTITGDNLLGATAVSFGGTAAASYTVVSPTSITAVLGDAQTGSVSVTTPVATVALPGFRYKAIWTGATGSASGTADNWNANRAPQSVDDIVFSSTAESDMELSGPLTAANLDFNGSARTLNLGSHNLTVTGDLTMPGTITGTGRVIMGGSSAQTITGGGSSLTDLEINNTGGGVIISGSGGELVVTGRLRMTGGSLNANGKLRLSSTFDGTARVGTLGSGASITGDVIAERYIPQNSNESGTGRAWRLVSVPVTGAGTLRDFFMNGRAGQDLTLSATRSAETSNSGTPIVGHNYADATAATTAGSGTVRGFDWIGVANQVSSLRRYVGDGSGGTFLSENVPDLSTSYASADQGYMVFTRGDRKVEFPSTNNSSATTFRSTGALKTGNQTVSVQAAGTSKYTLVGNPYMSVLDLSLVHADAANSGLLKSSFWIWDANIAGTFNQGAYVNVFKSGDQWVTNTGTYINPERIESGMAFFVEPVSSGGTLTISETHKSSETSAGLTPFSTDKSDDHGRLYVRLERSSGSGMPQIIDGVMADFHKDFKETLGDGSDREKLRNGISRGSLWMSQENRILSSQGLPWPKADIRSTVPVYMSGVGDQTLVLRIDPRGMDKNYVKGWLRDKVLKRETELDMTKPTDYDFIGTGSSSWDSTRFELVFTEAGRPTTGGVAIEPDGGTGNPSVRLYPNPSHSTDVKLSLRSMPAGDYRVQVLDMSGRLVATARFTHRGTNGEYRVLEGRRLSPGKYIVRLIDGKGGMQVLQMASE